MRHDTSSVAPTPAAEDRKMQPRSALGCSISVISLQKLKTFLEQPKYRPPLHHPQPQPQPQPQQQQHHPQQQQQHLPQQQPLGTNNSFHYPPPPPQQQHHQQQHQQQQQYQQQQHHHHDSRNIEESLQGSVDSSQLPSLFGGGANNGANNGGGQRVSNHGPQMLQAAKKGLLSQLGGPPQDVALGPMPTKMSPQHQNPNDMNPSANGSGGKKYQCKMCPQVFGSKADLQLHTQIHMRNAKPYKCSQCSKTFANSSYLSQHTRIHLGIKPYRCEICHRKFTQLSHLQQHIRTHTGDKPYKCRYPGCNKAFSQLSNLQSHSRCHQTDKPYKCNSCYKCFTEEAALLEHIPKHKESKHLKTHICRFCGKSYTQETYLAKHMQKHADRMDKHHQGMMAAMMPFQPPEALWQKAMHQAKEAASSADSGLGSSVAAMAAVAIASSSAAQQQQQHRTAMLLDNGEQENNQSCGDLLPPSQGLYDVVAPKSSSAFTPIQAMGSPGRTPYFPYESMGGFKGSHSPDPKAAAHGPSFPNQLISLKQIRSYAAMPGISPMDHHPIGLKGKGGGGGPN